MTYYEDQRIGETVMERTGGYPQIYPALYAKEPQSISYWELRWPILWALRKKMSSDKLG